MDANAHEDQSYYPLCLPKCDHEIKRYDVCGQSSMDDMIWVV